MNHSLFAELEAEVRREFAVRKERRRKLRNAGMLVSMSIVFAFLGTALAIWFSLIPALGWVSIVVFFAAVLGLQKMILINPSRNASWFWWLLFTGVMSYFIAPMIGFAVWRAYGNEALLVIILGLCGVLSWLFVTISYAGLTRLDLIGLCRPGIRRGERIFLNSWLASYLSYGGMLLGTFYPWLISLGWVPIIIVCFAGLFSLTRIKNPNSVSGLVWLLLFTFLAGYFIAPLVNIIVPDESGLFSVFGVIAAVVIFYSSRFFRSVPVDSYFIHPHGKVDVAGIWILAVLLSLIFYGR